MCVDIKNLAESVNITGDFSGTYKNGGGVSYYLNGTDRNSEIHFTVSGKPNDTFRRFHISHPVGKGGMNGSAFYYRGQADTDKDKNQHLPTKELQEWEAWIAKNRAACDAAATEFWNTLNTCAE